MNLTAVYGPSYRMGDAVAREIAPAKFLLDLGEVALVEVVEHGTLFAVNDEGELRIPKYRTLEVTLRSGMQLVLDYSERDKFGGSI